MDTVGPAQLLHEAASRPSTLTGERPELPSTSNTSLTPPPPTSDDVVRDMEDHVPEDGNEDVSPVANGRGHGGSDDWDTYQRQRGVRGFGAAPGDVKLEPSEEEATPVQERNGMRNHNRALSFQVPSVVDTPTQSTPPSVGSSSRQKKRRGEDLLLLDDHLLPAEMRKTGSLTGKPKGGTAKEEEDHEENVEVNGQQELDDLEALPTGGDEQTAADEREETEDTTRCVCRRDGM